MQALRQRTRLGEPSHRLASRRVDHLMAELQRAGIDARHGAQNVKTGPGSQLLLKGRVPARWAIAHASIEAIAYSGEIEEVPRRVGEPIEVIGDGEVLDDVAFPRVDDAPIGLEPLSHSAPPTIQDSRAAPWGRSLAF